VVALRHQAPRRFWRELPGKRLHSAGPAGLLLETDRRIYGPIWQHRRRTPWRKRVLARRWSQHQPWESRRYSHGRASFNGWHHEHEQLCLLRPSTRVRGFLSVRWREVGDLSTSRSAFRQRPDLWSSKGEQLDQRMRDAKANQRRPSFENEFKTRSVQT
jgi:hypothetical protein